MLSGTESLPHPEIAGLLGPQLTAEQARLIYDAGADAVIFALLTLARQTALQAQPPSAAGADPSRPSGQTPTYLKPIGKRRRKSPGAKTGHPGRRRATPEPNAFVTHSLDACPECGGSVTRLPSTRTRIVEDIPEGIAPVVTEHTIPRYYCKTCGKSVEPTVPDALPGSQMGSKVVVLSA